MCRYLAKDVHILCHLSVHTCHVLLTCHISISSLRDEVYLLLPMKYIFSGQVSISSLKNMFLARGFRAIDNHRVNGMLYDYLVLYSDYRADIWYYLAHLYIQKIGILIVFLVNFR